MTRVSTSPAHPRLRRELRTIAAMIAIYCRAHHQPVGRMCDQCAELLDYADRRLSHCPFQENKPTCGNSRVHCYQAARRQQVREVMGYAGPRMIFRHPLMAIRHLLDGRRKAPKPPRRSDPPSIAPIDHQEESS